MSDTNLRSSIIRLASTNPELRPHLLPLLTKTAGSTFGLSGLVEFVANQMLSSPAGKAQLTRSVTAWATKTGLSGDMGQLVDGILRVDLEISPADKDEIAKIERDFRATGAFEGKDIGPRY